MASSPWLNGRAGACGVSTGASTATRPTVRQRLFRLHLPASKERPCLGDVAANLFFQVVEGGEALLVAQAGEEAEGEGLAVEIAVEVEERGFEDAGRAADGRSHAEV